MDQNAEMRLEDRCVLTPHLFWHANLEQYITKAATVL